MLRLFNTLTKKKQLFKPLKGKTVTMYNCGPTVYNYVHIGNLRAFLFADTLRRTLEWQGYTVKQIMNITDVGHMVNDAETGEDKLELSAARERKTPLQIATFYTDAFFRDIDALGIERATQYPRATEHIPEMVDMIKSLIKKGKAYTVNGSVYYAVNEFSGYGKLSGNSLKSLISGARIEPHPDKRSSLDFALWIENPHHIMQWKAPWSEIAGYPGWHIECSAMAKKYLGPTIDIHTGGEDHIFPHHECEIAQSEGATGKKMAHYFMHVKHLLVEGEKMSKSLGNTYRIDDVIARGFDARTLRFYLLSVHYRDTMNFTWEGLAAARDALARIDGCYTRLVHAVPAPKSDMDTKRKVQSITEKLHSSFDKALLDDLNISGALGAVFQYITALNTLETRQAPINAKLNALMTETLVNIMKPLGIIPVDIRVHAGEEALHLLNLRNKARHNKQWDRADVLRREIEALGYRVVDTSSGTALERI